VLTEMLIPEPSRCQQPRMTARTAVRTARV